MFKWATFRKILLPSSGNVNDYVAHIYKENMRTFTETINVPIRRSGAM